MMKRQFVNTRRNILKAYESESPAGGLAILAKLNNPAVISVTDIHTNHSNHAVSR